MLNRKIFDRLETWYQGDRGKSPLLDGARQELDFIYKDGDGIAVLECKSGEDPKDHKSLDAILRTSAIKISRTMVLCREDVMVEGPITYYPLYMAMFL